jgi:hypothetical protein
MEARRKICLPPYSHMALKSHYDVEANYLEMIQQKLDTEVFGKPLEVSCRRFDGRQV